MERKKNPLQSSWAERQALRGERRGAKLLCYLFAATTGWAGERKNLYLICLLPSSVDTTQVASEWIESCSQGHQFTFSLPFLPFEMGLPISPSFSYTFGSYHILFVFQVTSPFPKLPNLLIKSCDDISLCRLIVRRCDNTLTPYVALPLKIPSTFMMLARPPRVPRRDQRRDAGSAQAVRRKRNKTESLSFSPKAPIQIQKSLVRSVAAILKLSRQQIFALSFIY